jgi:hypothetical protein
LIGGWVGPRVVLDAVVKRKIPSPRRESKPRIRNIAMIIFNKQSRIAEKGVNLQLGGWVKV